MNDLLVGDLPDLSAEIPSAPMAPPEQYTAQSAQASAIPAPGQGGQPLPSYSPPPPVVALSPPPLLQRPGTPSRAYASVLGSVALSSYGMARYGWKGAVGGLALGGAVFNGNRALSTDVAAEERVSSGVAAVVGFGLAAWMAYELFAKE